MVISFDRLPPELYDDILSQVPPYDRQSTTYALSCALPRSSVPTYHLYRYIRLKDAEQVLRLHRHLRNHRHDASYTVGLSLESWSIDADVAINLMALFPQLRELTLFVGPNFAPEHLEEIFEKPIEGLRYLSLRFRPYVQRATYYQFLKGAYFDTMLLALSRWPVKSLPSISLIQDPLNDTIAPTGKFAQPLVFFRLDPFSKLAISPLFSQLKHFRLRVPSRQVARFIYTPTHAMPRLELLDMSTCNVVESDVELILGRFQRLRCLVLDECSVVNPRGDPHDGTDERQGQWAALGKTMALAGIKRTKAREKQLNRWLEELALSRLSSLRVEDQPAQPASPASAAQRASKIKKGRRGLATATISLRERQVQENSTPVSGPSGTRQSSAAAAAAGDIPKIRILPPAPSLRSFAITLPAPVKIERHDAVRAEFERGWAEGLAQLSAVRGRLRQSWRNGVRVVRFVDVDEYAEEPVGGREEEGLDGLEDVEDEAAFGVGIDTPVICLAGPGRKEGHVGGCGHQLGWEIWGDEL